MPLVSANDELSVLGDSFGGNVQFGGNTVVEELDSSFTFAIGYYVGVPIESLAIVFHFGHFLLAVVRTVELRWTVKTL